MINKNDTEITALEGLNRIGVLNNEGQKLLLKLKTKVNQKMLVDIEIEHKLAEAERQYEEDANNEEEHRQEGV